jgi:hypothetical protein
MYWMFVFPLNSYVKTLTHSVLVLDSESCDRQLSSYEMMKVELPWWE